MAGGRLCDARLAYSAMHRPLEHLFVGMMPPDDARAMQRASAYKGQWKRRSVSPLAALLRLSP